MEDVQSIAKDIGKKAAKITDENFGHTVLTFRDRQAGIGLVYDPDVERYFYNVYCVETKLMKEIFTCEYEYLSEALENLNAEFGTWESQAFDEKKGCGSCVAK